MTRLLHTADWQIGRQYSRFEAEDGTVLADARFQAVSRLAELANQAHADAVLGAGDIFDAQTVSDRTLHRTFQAMQAFAGPWLLLPGNHDAALAESVWTRAQRLGAVPDNVHLLTTPEVVAFEDAGFVILPAPLTQRQTFDDLTAWLDDAETPPGLARIGLAHGSVTGVLAESMDATNPIAADRAAAAGLDYLALGDWHGCKQIDERTWYSGTPEPDRFRNNDAGKALMVDIEARGTTPTITEHATAQYAWHQPHHSLTIASDLDVLYDALNALPDSSVVDLTLDGRIDLVTYQRLEQDLGAAAGRHRSFQTDLAELELLPTDDDIANLQADGYVADVIADLRDRQDEQESEADRRTASRSLAILAGLLHEQSTEEGTP